MPRTSTSLSANARQVPRWISAAVVVSLAAAQLATVIVH